MALLGASTMATVTIFSGEIKDISKKIKKYFIKFISLLRFITKIVAYNNAYIKILTNLNYYYTHTHIVKM